MRMGAKVFCPSSAIERLSASTTKVKGFITKYWRQQDEKSK